MGFKERLQKKIQKNAVESEVSWTDSSGKLHKEKVILKRSKIPVIGDWGRIYPPINEDGSTNWMNTLFGGKKNFMKLVILMILIGLTFYWVSGVIGAGKEYLNGQKYVIVEKTAFEKFCKTAIYEEKGELITTPNNLTLFLEKKLVEEG